MTIGSRRDLGVVAARCPPVGRAATRRVTVVFAAAALLLGSSVGASASAKARVVRHSYSFFPEGIYFPFGGFGVPCAGGCLYAVARRNEHHLRIDVRDKSGLPVYGQLSAPGYGTYRTGFGSGTTFCGSTVLTVSAGEQIRVQAPANIQPLLPCAEATTGTIVATFSR
ncbi:MAG: hypothetical protein ACYDH6_20365 [Acidimicrobiales bacterium]